MGGLRHKGKPAKTAFTLWIGFFILLCLGSAYGIGAPVACAEPGHNQPTPPVIRYSSKLELTPEDALIYRPIHSAEVVIAAEYDNSGRLSCATPVAGQSFYWPYAIRALATRPGESNSGLVAYVFSDPVQTDLLKETRSSDLRTSCSPKDALDVLMRHGRALAFSERDEARKCFQLAVERSTDSVTAEYGAGLTMVLQKNTALAIKYYQKAISLRPDFYEAQLALIQIYSTSAAFREEEEALKNILERNPPPPIQAKALHESVKMYENLDRPSEAASAQQSEIDSMREIQALYPNLIRQYQIASELQVLALHLEGLKKYETAELHYREAVTSGRQSKMMSEAAQFEAEMGRARSLRQLGNHSAAQELCSSWKARLNEIGAGLNDIQWQVEDLTKARWELSCGDFHAALKKVQEIAKREASSNKEADPYRIAAPYHALEMIYSARGDTRKAKLAHDSADRIISARSSVALSKILSDAGVLFDGQSAQ
jgi:tetratricopeptide (TPR) repeat protein